MDVFEALLMGMDEIFGLPSDELRADPDIDLIEQGLIDSLGIVSLINYVESQIGYKIDIKSMSPGDFTTVNTIAAAIEAQKQY